MPVPALVSALLEVTTFPFNPVLEVFLSMDSVVAVGGQGGTTC